MKRSIHTLEPDVGATCHSARCRLCGRAFVRVLRAGAHSRYFRFCDRCRQKAASVIDAVETLNPSDEYMTG